MYSCGFSKIANFFSLRRTDNNKKLQILEHFPSSEINRICIHQEVAIILFNDGSVHTFGSESDLLGHSSSSTKVTAFETIRVADISVGGGYFFAIDESGKVFGWGENQKGQLGWRESPKYSSPKLIKTLQMRKINMVSCGQGHSLFLEANGAIWSSGQNDYGQLGLRVDYTASTEAQPLSSLQGIPFLQVVAGYWHSLALTVSGTVFSWGRNDFGQLGLGDTNDRNVPFLLKSLRNQDVRFITAGELHTVALTTSGGVFTFGANTSGQLGHGQSTMDGAQQCVVMPRQVFELMGARIVQAACGRSHTLTLAHSAENVYGFGDNSCGQLGECISQNKEEFLPVSLQLPRKPLIVKEIFAGGNETLIFTSSRSHSAAINHQKVPFKKMLFTMSNDFIDKLYALDVQTKVTSDLAKHFDCVFSSPACLNASFLSKDHFKTSSYYHGIDFSCVRLAFSRINHCACKHVVSRMAEMLQTQLIPNLYENPPDVEALRIYLFLPECHLFSNKDFYYSITIPFAKKCTSLTKGAAKVLQNWYLTLEPNYFERQVVLYIKAIEHILSGPIPIFDNELQGRLFSGLEFLRRLNHVNNTSERTLISYEKFYIPDVTRHINLEDDYVRWLTGKTMPVCFCSYPFLLNSIAKTSLLQIDAVWQMRAAFRDAQDRNMASLFGMNENAFIELPVLELEVRRDALVHDALSKLAQIEMPSLKKPLIVKFEGEDGEDAGGVRKEFFMLLLKEVLDPKYGMFRYYEESRFMWFSGYELETDMMYFLVGLLCGLAIYNSTIIDLCFPLALYKKLLGEKININDLKELDPTVSKSVQQLLDFCEDMNGKIEDVFCLNFSVTVDNLGETRLVDLKPGGTEIAVTGENRKEYVELYLDYVFNKSASDQFEAFNKGFHKVCGGRILELFRPTELREMVVGNQNYDWVDFEKQAVYKGEYFRNHQTIILFWDVFHSLTLKEKKQFLLFLTGSDNVPITGVKITIQPVKSSENHLPVAHTCFNLLDLPLYKSKTTLRNKLLQAMQNNQGFHLV